METSSKHNLQQIARTFHVEVFKPEHSTGNGIAIVIGSGLLMATMDEIRTLGLAMEWSKDQAKNPYLVDWLSISALRADYVFVNAWFSISKPDLLRYALQTVPSNKLFIKSNVDLGSRGTTFDSFASASAFLNQFKSNTPVTR